MNLLSLSTRDSIRCIHGGGSKRFREVKIASKREPHPHHDRDTSRKNHPIIQRCQFNDGESIEHTHYVHRPWEELERGHNKETWIHPKMQNRPISIERLEHANSIEPSALHQVKVEQSGALKRRSGSCRRVSEKMPQQVVEKGQLKVSRHRRAE